MPDRSKANEISIRFQAARVDGTWQELRRKLNMEQREEGLKFENLKEIYLEKYVRQYNRDVESKESRLRILGRRFNSLSIDALTPRRVTDFIVSRRRAGASNQTINRDLLVLKHMLSWATREQYMAVNPLPAIQLLKEIQFEGKRPEESIIDAVFSKLDPRVIPLFTFIRETGCRREEALALRHTQITGSEVVFWKTKNGRNRYVPLTTKAREAISAMPKASE
jgi:integrase